MIILGIDPGTTTIGYSLIKQQGSSLDLIAADAITTPPKAPQEDKLARIHQEIVRLIDIHRPEVLALEKLFFFKNNKTAFQVSEARGVIIAAAKIRGIEVYQFTPLETKIGVTGYGKADKKQVHYMVKHILKLTTMPKLDDVSDAMAVAITCANAMGMKHIHLRER